MMKKMSVLCGISAGIAVAGFATADSQSFDIANVESWDSPGSALNHLINFDVGAGSHITGVSWDNVVGNGQGGPSWGNEMTMGMLDEGQAYVYLQFFPSEGSSTAGGVWGPATGGSSTNLVDAGISFYSANGNASLEFFEAYDDGTGAVDAVYNSGTITVYWESVAPPVPGLGGMAVLAGVGLLGRRRR